MTELVLFGEVLFDCFDDGSRVLGGAPFNVGWNLTALGADVLLVTRVGDDALGEQICTAMQQRGMDTAGVQIDARHATGQVSVRIDDGEPHYDIVTGSAWDFIQPDQIPAAARGRPLYHGSLAARSPVSAAALEGLSHAAGSAWRFVDINLREPWWQRHTARELMRGAHTVKLNQAELAALQQGGDLAARMQALQGELGIDVLLVSRGERGAVTRLADGRLLDVQPPASAALVDAVGAGDAFASVMLLGRLRGWPLSLTLERAQQLASAVVGLRGATSTDDTFYAPLRAAWAPS